MICHTGGHIFLDNRPICQCGLIDRRLQKATRATVNYRYDILDSDFLHLMAEIAHYGAEKYGDLNWQKSRLLGNNSPINHIYHHLHQYKKGELHDKFGTKSHQLVAIAFNAMMEYFYAQQEERDKEGPAPEQPPESRKL